MNSAPTILQIVPRLETGGVERTAIDIACALARAGARAIVASEGGRMVGELTAGGEWLNFPAATKNPARMLRNAGALAEIIRREQVRIIHARSRAPAWSALLAARRTGIPFVTTYAGAYNQKGLLKAAYNGVMARGDAVIANSHYTAELIRGRYHLPASRLHIVPRGIDLTAFDPDRLAPVRIAALRAAWGIEEEDIVLLPARLTRWKGQAVLIEAAKILKAEGLDRTVFVLAGDAQGRTDYVEALRRSIQESGLERMVRRVGHCADMPAAYALATLTVIPSIEPEAFGRTAVEAQAMGRPVIVSDIGATPETVCAPPQVEAERRTGWRIPPGDPTRLAQAIREALALDEDARAALGRRARAHAAGAFSVERMARETLAIYDALAGSALRERFDAATRG